MADLRNGVWGDCQRAVIASLLELPLDAVPHFAQEAKGDPNAFYEGIQLFCRSHGFLFARCAEGEQLHAFGDDGDIYCSISGPSPRGNGMHHAVVGKNGQICHDPHPSRDGLVGDPKDWKFSYLVKA